VEKLLPQDPEAVEIIRGAERANEVDHLVQYKKGKKRNKISAVHSAPMKLTTIQKQIKGTLSAVHRKKF
jgi:hypothetical protein